MTEQLFDKSKELLRTMSRAQLQKLKSKVEMDLQLESMTYPDPKVQKAYTPMPWMIPNMERTVKVITELLNEPL